MRISLPLKKLDTKNLDNIVSNIDERDYVSLSLFCKTEQDANTLRELMKDAKQVHIFIGRSE